jgi:cellulose synthase/poly-beta-1,6-N-acetylglucosamine synthase-like glycosyltransferase
MQNEEKVVEQKLRSILHNNYPKEKLTVFIGLDACTDSTREIIEHQFKFAHFKTIEFPERIGKPGVINKIIQEYIPADNSILILTDANIIFTESTIYELVKYFKDPQIGLVDSDIQPERITNDNERDYWNYETEIKKNESAAYGIIPGPSGGCYAIRRNLFSPVPSNFLVDDFFIGFNIVTQHHKAILNSNAICYEDVVTNWKDEFRRKVRIATGNFQNLWHFRKFIFKKNLVSFIFISHKIIRWITPFILLILYAIMLVAAPLFILIVTLFLPLIDLLLFTFGMEFKPLRRFHYFIVMNAAVFTGFLKFCKGVKNNVWQPTTRK